jgi:lysozyme
VTIFGIDIARHQKGINLSQVFEKPGFEFLAAKMTEGQGYADTQFSNYHASAKRLGLLFTAYHWVRSDSSANAQAANVEEHLPEHDIPVMLDVERTEGGSPRWDDVLGVTQALHKRGIRVGLLYMPEWYWIEIGRPRATAFKGLFQSDYGSNNGVYPGDHSERWNYGGGHKPVLLQYTSKGRLPGYSGSLDIDAYRGTRAELAKTGWFKDYAKKAAPATMPKPTPKPVSNTVTRFTAGVEALARKERIPANREAARAAQDKILRVLRDEMPES